jgi:hypothetical protein
VDNVVGVVRNFFMQLRRNLWLLHERARAGRERPCPIQRLRKSLLLAYLSSRVIIGSLNILVDIGVPAEKEVIQ